MPDSLAAVFLDELQCDAAAAHRLAGLWARQLMMEPSEVRAWLRAGLQAHEGHVVDELRQYGVTPQLMRTMLRGETMVDRMRDRAYTPYQIAQTLEAAGLMRSTA